MFTVTAYRFGDRERHSYVVGVYSTEQKARDEAWIEEEWRGGNKYSCEILEWLVDQGIAGEGNRHASVIKSPKFLLK